MYLVPLKTLIVLALRKTFTDGYPEADFSHVNVSIEYPVDEQGYPSIWVDYDDTEALERAGIDHHDRDSFGLETTGTRWRFAGTATLTVVALSSLERDRLYDQLVRVIAFAPQSAATFEFRKTLESNDLIAVNANFDQVHVQGNAAAPGTPWGTDEIIYERGVAIDLVGEFALDPVTGSLVALTRIKLDPAHDTTDAPLVLVPSSPAGSVTDWH